MLLISGGVLNITIGAFLNGSAPKLPQNALFAVQNGWYLLSTSLVLALLFALLHVVAQGIIIEKWKKKFSDRSPRIEVIQGAGWFRILIWAVLITAFLCCVAGIVFISYGAAQIIHLHP
jgi:magnesium-transporting ATPase (P-type)